MACPGALPSGSWSWCPEHHQFESDDAIAAAHLRVIPISTDPTVNKWLSDWRAERARAERTEQLLIDTRLELREKQALIDFLENAKDPTYDEERFAQARALLRTMVDMARGRASHSDTGSDDGPCTCESHTALHNVEAFLTIHRHENDPPLRYHERREDEKKEEP
jgi:hypothetical protein